MSCFFTAQRIAVGEGLGERELQVYLHQYETQRTELRMENNSHGTTRQSRTCTHVNGMRVDCGVMVKLEGKTVTHYEELQIKTDQYLCECSTFHFVAYYTKSEDVEIYERHQLALAAGHHEVLKALTPENARQFVDEDGDLNVRIVGR